VVFGAAAQVARAAAPLVGGVDAGAVVVDIEGESA
jgi:hypothetical protein